MATGHAHLDTWPIFLNWNKLDSMSLIILI